MAVKRAKSKEYQLAVARNFLRNISLDGTHEDTGLRIFNRPGFQDINFPERKQEGSKMCQVAFDENSPTVLEIDGNKPQMVNTNPSSITQRPEIQVESPKSAEENRDSFAGSSEFRSDRSISPHVNDVKMESRPPALLKKGCSSSPVLHSTQRKLPWRGKKSSKASKHSGRRTSEILRSSEQKRRHRKISSSPMKKSVDKESSEGPNFFRKISNFLAPPMGVTVSSKNSSSNVSASSLDTSRSEDSLCKLLLRDTSCQDRDPNPMWWVAP